jgi:hypothetical protein
MTPLDQSKGIDVDTLLAWLAEQNERIARSNTSTYVWHDTDNEEDRMSSSATDDSLPQLTPT